MQHLSVLTYRILSRLFWVKRGKRKKGSWIWSYITYLHESDNSNGEIRRQNDTDTAAAIFNQHLGILNIIWFQMQQGSGRKESKQGYCCNEAVSDSEIIVLMIIKFIEKTSMQSGYGGGVLFYIHCSLNFTLCGYMDDLGIMDSIWETIS